MTESWAVSGESGSVTAWSRTRLAFEPRGEMLEFRAALRAKLRRLDQVPHAGLIASYSSPDDEYVDVENVALYNVGAGAYSHLAAAGLYCERFASDDERHHLHYRLGPLPPPPSSRLLARATTAVPVDTHTPGPWWAQFSRKIEVIDAAEPVAGAFAVDVTLLGGWTGPKVAAVVKPMLDGLVSALHQHDGSARDDLLARLSHLGDPDQMWAALCTPGANVLGTRRLVRVHRTGIAWNPADERCHAFRVRIMPAQSRTVRAEVSIR